MKLTQLLEGQFDEPQGVDKKRAFRALKDKLAVLNNMYTRKNMQCKRILDVLTSSNVLTLAPGSPLRSGYVRKQVLLTTIEFKDTPENHVLFDKYVQLVDRRDAVLSRVVEISRQLEILRTW